MLKTGSVDGSTLGAAYHLGEGRVLKTEILSKAYDLAAYHLGERRVLKTFALWGFGDSLAYHLGEGCVLKVRQSGDILLS